MSMLFSLKELRKSGTKETERKDPFTGETHRAFSDHHAKNIP
jgi:hypothetical protein